jgi:hypothetical protein
MRESISSRRTPWLLSLMRGGPPSTEGPARSRRRLGARVIGGLTLVTGLAFVSVNAYPVEAPAPLWTLEDLASEVPESDNGWGLVVVANELEIPEQLAPLVEPSDHEADRYWADVDARADALREFLGTSAAREAISQFDAARSRPAFEDACPDDGPCLVLDWRQTHRVAALRAVDLAVAGESADACMLLRDLIEMDVAHLHSARSLLSFLVARANLQEALDKADMIAVRLGTGDDMTEDTRAALVELAVVARAVDITAINLQRVVIGEYVSLVELLDDLDGGDPQARERVGMPRGIGWLFNRALTMRSLNARFEGRYRGATEHDAAAVFGGDEASPRQQLGWWFRNPVGKIYIDMTRLDFESVVEDIHAELAELSRTRALLLARPAVRAALANG